MTCSPCSSAYIRRKALEARAALDLTARQSLCLAIAARQRAIFSGRPVEDDSVYLSAATERLRVSASPSLNFANAGAE